MQEKAFAPSDVYIVMPVYNEGSVAVSTIRELRRYGYTVVAVNDGSTDGTMDCLLSLNWIHTLDHVVNLGQGAALQTGIAYALRSKAEYIVTFDSDGQHPAGQIRPAIDMLIESHADVILGSRFLSGFQAVNMPALKRVVLQLATVFTRFSCRIRVTDTHNGFRVFTREAARTLNITQNRMSHATQILHQISRNKLKYGEIPVAVLYTEHSMRKGQKLSNSLNILWDSLFSKH